MLKRMFEIVLVVFLIQIFSCDKQEIINENNITNDDISIGLYGESPDLKLLVTKGNIPSVEKRIPQNPLIVQPDKSIGLYGGTWNIPIRELKNKGILVSVLGYENLVSWDPEWTKVIPNIAQSWSVNENSTVYTFQIREGIKWSDGTLFSVDDILFYFEVMSNENVNRNGLSKWLTIDGIDVKVTKTGENKVTFTFASSYGMFLQKLATTAGTRLTGMPKHYLSQFLLENNSNVLNTYKENGYETWQDQFFIKADFSKNIELPTLNPWLLQDVYTPLTTDIIRAKRNPYYWKIDPNFNQLPYIDELNFIVSKDDEEINNRTLAGEFNMSMTDLSGESIKDYNTLVNSGDFKYYSKIPSSMNNMTIEFNLNHPDPVIRKMFQDKNFRIALSYGINREKIIEDIYGGEGEPYQLAPRPESPLYNDNLAKQYTEYNPILAKELLDKSGYILKENGKRVGLDGKEISIKVTIADLFGKNWPEAIKYIQKDWADLGIDLVIEETDWRGLDLLRNNALHDILVWNGSGGLEVTIIPDYYFPFSSESGYAMKWMWWYQNSNDFYEKEEPPELVKKQMLYFDQLKSTGDLKQQNTIMAKILNISEDQFYSLGISLPLKSFGITKANFKNVPLLMPESWAYPTPGPTNPCQYYIE